MKISVSRVVLTWPVWLVAFAGGSLVAVADDSTSYKGLELTAKSVERDRRVSLPD